MLSLEVRTQTKTAVGGGRVPLESDPGKRIVCPVCKVMDDEMFVFFFRIW